ncbi:MAG: drug/metabolite exporter YedA [Anaerolineae bacterium]|nr:drug/metabolite exporter YedA [Anaerolineae bacterium]
MTGNPSPTPPTRWLIFAALGSLYFIWGSTYVGIRIALETLPPFLMAGTRFVIAGTILYAWMRTHGTAHPTRLNWRSAFLVGGLMLVGGNGGVTFAELHVPSTFAALLIAAMPLWMVLLNWLFFGGSRPNRQMTSGLALGFAGVALLIGPEDLIRGEGLSLIGVTALMIAAITWATGSLYSRRAPLPSAPLMATGIEMLAGGALLLLLGLANGEAGDVNVSEFSARSLVAMLYLTLFGSLLAFSAYTWLLRHTTPARATSYAYVNPIVAVFLGWALAGETITARILIAAGIIVTSVVMITSYRAQQDTRTATPRTTPGGVRLRSGVRAGK